MAMRLTAAISGPGMAWLSRSVRDAWCRALELYFEDESEIVVNESPTIVAVDVAV